MDVGCKLTPAVLMAEEVAYYGEDGAEGLEGDVPAGADDLGGSQSDARDIGRRVSGETYSKDHAGWEDDAEREDLDPYVDPQYGILPA